MITSVMFDMGGTLEDIFVDEESEWAAIDKLNEMLCAAGLDPMGREVLLSQIVNYHKQCHNTVIFVSHTMEDIARVADKIIVMNKGRLAMFEPTKEVFRRGDELAQYGLRVPQITKIMQDLLRKGFNVPEGVLTVDEAFSALVPLLKKEGQLW